MKRSWSTYIAVFIGLLVAVFAADYVLTKVLDSEAAAADTDQISAALTIASLLLILLGVHVVAMFAATPAWRRRSLYVSRLAWGAGLALVIFATMLLGPDLAAILATDSGESSEEDPAPPSPEGVPPSTANGAGAIRNAEPHSPNRDAAPPENDDETATESDDETDSEPLVTLPSELVRWVVSVVLLLAFLLVVRSGGESFWRSLGFSRRRLWRHIAIGVAAYAAFTWAIMPIAQTGVAVVFRLLSVPMHGHEAVEEFRETTALQTRLALVLGIAFRAPLFEEIMFRGVLFQTIKRYTGSAPAIVVSAIVFALLHGTWFVIINIFFLGLLFGYLFDKTGSIVPGIVLHFLFNSTTLVIILATG